MCEQFGILHQESRQCVQLTWVTVGTGVGDGVTTAASGAKVGSGVGLQEHTQYQASYLFVQEPLRQPFTDMPSRRCISSRCWAMTMGSCCKTSAYVTAGPRHARQEKPEMCALTQDLMQVPSLPGDRRWGGRWGWLWGG